MAFVKIRGAQIQDGAIVNAHVASNAAIHETKLDIDWAGKSSTILSQKKVVDFVQVNGTDVSGVSSVDVTALGIIANTVANTTSDPLDVEGIIVSGTKNVAPLRDATTGDPLLTTAGYEVYGRITFVNDAAVAVAGETLGGTVDGVNTTFTFANKNIVSGSEKIYFGTTLQSNTTYTMDYVNGTVTFATAPASGTVITADYSHDQDGAGKYKLNLHYSDGTAEQVYTAGTSQVIDWQYAQRFNLDSVNEMFAANEKFVEGAADATAHLNIEQLAKDLYSTVSLDRDGNANLVRPLQDEIVVQTSGLTNTTVRANTIIDEVVTARGTYADLNGRLNALDQKISDTDTALRNDLASNLNGKGASLVGIEDAAAKFTATTVEGALTELANNIGSTSDAYIAADELHMKETGSVGVKTGGYVGPTATASMNLDVLASVVYNAEGKRFDVAAGQVTIPAADATSPRIDIVYVDANGALAVATGTPAATPSAPAVPAGGVKLADVSVPAGDTAIESSQVTDKREYIATDAEVQDARSTFATLNDRLNNLESGGSSTSQEVEDARSRDAATRNGYYALQTFTSLEARLVDIENVADGKFKVADDNATELSNARSRDAASLNAYFAIQSFTDIEGRFVNVETVLDEKAKIADDNKAEIEAARASTALTGVEVLHSTLDARLEASETQIKKNQDEIEGARSGVDATGVATTFTTLDGRLDAVDTRNTNQDTRMQTIEDNAIQSYKYVYTATGGESVVNLPVGDYYKMGDDSLDVYVNGILQVGGVHYVEVEDTAAVGSTKGVAVDFAPDTFVSGDYVTLRYTKKASF